MTYTTRSIRILTAAALTVGTLMLVGCGSDPETSSTTTQQTTTTAPPPPPVSSTTTTTTQQTQPMMPAQ